MVEPKGQEPHRESHTERGKESKCEARRVRERKRSQSYNSKGRGLSEMSFCEMML